MDKKTKIILGAVIIILIFCVVVFFIMSQKEYQKSDFIGTWYGESQEDEYNSTTTLVCNFYNNDSVKLETHSAYFKDNRPILTCDADEINNTLTVTNVEQYSHHILWGNWDIKNNKLSIILENDHTPTCDFKFENDNKMGLTLDSIEFELNKTEETEFDFSQTHVDWNDVYIDAYLLENNESKESININLTGSSYSLNLSPKTVDNKSYWNYGPTEWGEITVDDILQFPKDDAKYLVSMMFRTSIDPPEAVGIGDYWSI